MLVVLVCADRTNEWRRQAELASLCVKAKKKKVKDLLDGDPYDTYVERHDFTYDVRNHKIMQEETECKKRSSDQER